MKKFNYYCGAVVLFIFTTLSCSSDDKKAAPVEDTTAIVNTVSQGTWRVTNYIDHTLNQTDHFTGYIFTFGSGNVLTATIGTNNIAGTWSVTNTSSSDDSPEDPIDFNIAFTAPADFEDINDDWDIVSRTATKIELIDVSGSSDNTDYLTFEKN